MSDDTRRDARALHNTLNVAIRRASFSVPACDGAECAVCDLILAYGASQREAGRREARALVAGLRDALIEAQQDLHTRHRPSTLVAIERCAGTNCQRAMRLATEAWSYLGMPLPPAPAEAPKTMSEPKESQ